MLYKNTQDYSRRNIFKLTEGKRGILFTLPLLLFMVVLYIYPIINSFTSSFQNSAGNWNNFINFKNLFSDTLFYQSLVNTIVFTFVSVTFHLIIGFGLALLLNLKLRTWVINLFRGIFMLPWLISTVVAAAIWALIYHPVGILNYFLNTIGIINEQIGWLGDTRFALLAVTFVNIWKAYPFYMIMISSALKTVPNELYEASRVDGAKAYQNFIHITLPQIRGVLVFMTLLDTIWTFRHFDLVFVMTQGGPINTTLLLTNHIYNVTFKNLQFNYGSTITVFMLVASMIFSYFYLKLYRTSSN